MKNNLLYVVLVLLLLGMSYFGTQAYTHALAYEKQTAELVSHQGIEGRATQQLESFAKSILGGYYDANETALLEEIKVRKALSNVQAQRQTLFFMGLMLIVLLSYFLISLRAFTLFGALAAMITLFFGLVSPILMVTIHKEVEYLGDVVLSFESKGVIGSIVKLYESGDWIVAAVVVLFSVITPVLKTVALLFVSIFIESKFAHGIVKFFKLIGKWSMVDVFVVAVFLVYLTSNKGDVSRAEVEVGLYFFLAYVIVSMLVSLTADKMLKKRVR